MDAERFVRGLRYSSKQHVFSLLIVNFIEIYRSFLYRIRPELKPSSTLSASAAQTGPVFASCLSGRRSWTLPSYISSPAVVPFSPVEIAPPASTYTLPRRPAP